MRDLSTLTFHPTAERLVEILCQKTQNNNPEFFRVLVCYYMAKVAATMRVKVLTKDRGEIPLNLYVINLASSGHGKGHSSNIMEESIINRFRERFIAETYPVIADESLLQMAVTRAIEEDVEEEDMLKKLNKEFEDLGELAFSFDSGTPAAVKQMRHKLLMGAAGAINLEIDEIGSNLLTNTEVLNTFLEMYDVGRIKQKLTKNTRENVRNKEIDGRTPANLLMFGTPAKLFDGSATEDAFFSFLETGYARRCLFGFSLSCHRNRKQTAEQIYDALVDTSVSQEITNMSVQFAGLADITNHNKNIIVPRAVGILLIEYKQHCEDIADGMGEHQDIARAEMAHRYFKALKLAGVYAFFDGSSTLTEDNLYHAIHMVEESGRAFDKIHTRERDHEKLAKYLATMPHEVTHVDLEDDLPVFKGAVQKKEQMIRYAQAWGHKNHIAITRTLVGGIEFLEGKTLQKTDLDRMILAYSKDISDGYQNANAPWSKLTNMTQKSDLHWINHHSTNGHRSEEFMNTGFNMVVLDIDDGATTVKECELLLGEYRYLIYTTKRHTPQKQRFRLIFPMNYILHLNENDYAEFMRNVLEWLPLSVDAHTGQRARKWASHNGAFMFSKGKELLDARNFIPKTKPNDERQAFVATYQSMTNMERWFLSNSTGNRNNQLSRYAFLMVDLGYTEEVIRQNVLELNAKLPDKLKEAEIDRTIMVTTAKKIAKLAAP